MPRPSAGRTTTVAALLAIVCLGAALRMVPAWRGADPDLLSDPAFHLRMTRAVIERGRTPAVDSLASAPAGRAIERLLPTGLYGPVALLHRLAAAVDRGDLASHARWFVALAGALVALPVFAATRALHPGHAPALLAALVAVLLPAHLHRSFGYWFRYEALGTLLIATHVACSLAALAGPTRRATRLAGAGAALAMLAALAVWRVAFIVPILEIGFVLVVALLRPPAAPLREWFGIQVLAGTLACLGLGYLREQSLVLSSAWLLAVGLAAALWTPWLAREDAPAGRRIGLVALIALLAAGAGRFALRERQYDQVLEAAWRRIGGTFGLAFPPAAPEVRLALGVDELQAGSAGGLFGPGELSWLGMAFVLAPFVWLAARGWRRGPLPPLAAAPALLAWLAASLTVVTLVVARNKIVLAPLVAVVVGGLVAALVPRAAPATTPGPRPTARPGARSRTGAGRGLRWAALALLALSVALTARDAASLALTRASRIDPGLRAALDWLARETPPGAVVLAPWQHGYEIQTLAGRPTVVDGLLEDPLTRGRIIAIARAWLASDTDSLAAICRATGADWVLVPPSSAFYGIAQLSEWPSAWKTRDGVPLGREEADRVLVRMMVLGESPPPFEKAFESADWRIYRRRE